MRRPGIVAATGNALAVILLLGGRAAGQCSITTVSPAQGAHISLPQQFTWEASDNCSAQTIVFVASWGMTTSSVIFPDVQSPFVLDQEYWDEIVGTLGQAEVYRWAVGTFEFGAWTYQSQSRTFVVGNVCSVTLDFPPSEQLVGFPAQFAWRSDGTCVVQNVAFSRTQSDDPSTWWLVSSNSPLTLTSAQWGEIETHLGQSESYYWTVVEDFQGWYIRVAGWQPFKVSASADRPDSGVDDGSGIVPPSEQPSDPDTAQGDQSPEQDDEEVSSSAPAFCGAGLLEAALLSCCLLTFLPWRSKPACSLETTP